VGNNEEPFSAVRKFDGTSRNRKRPRGVAVTFQVREHIVEPQRDEAMNILENDPSRSRECNDSAHLRPEVAIVSRCVLLSRNAVGLARKAGTDKIDSSEPTQSPCVESVDVIDAGDAGPMLRKYGSAVGIDFAEGNGAHAGSFKAE
jgi:hypothetical protein